MASPVSASTLPLAPPPQVLLAGRWVVGVAIGVSSMATPMYIAESAPAASRGVLVTTNCLFLTLGQVRAARICAYVTEATSLPTLLHFTHHFNTVLEYTL